MAIHFRLGRSFGKYAAIGLVVAHGLGFQAGGAAERQPYHVLLRQRGFVAGGSGLLEIEGRDRISFLRARRADGSRAELTVETGGNSPTYKVLNRRLFLLPERILTTTVAGAQGQSTVALRDDEVAVLRAGRADRSCRTNPRLVSPTEFLGYGEHLGYQVAKHRLKSQTARTEIWEAVALHCEAVWIRTEFLGSGGEVSDVSLQEAIGIEQGEAPGFVFAEEPRAAAGETFPRDAAAFLDTGDGGKLRWRHAAAVDPPLAQP